MNIETLLKQGQELQFSGQLLLAIRCYEQLLSLAPEHSETLGLLGLAHAQLGDMKKAVIYLQRAVELQSNDACLHNNLANAYKALQQFDKAIEHYHQALQLDPQYAQAHNNVATIYALRDDYQQALHHYRLAVHAKPDFAAAHYNLGLLLLKHNQLAAAKKQFTNVLSLHPNHIDAQFYLGILQLEDNELDKAEQSFHDILAVNNEHVDALNNLGVIAMKREQGQLAIDYFTKALALDNQNLDARNNLAATFIHHDRFENALMHYDVLLQKEPQNIEYLYNSGVAQMALGHLQEASQHFETILGLKNNHFASLNNLAAIQIRLGQREKAVALLERAIAANPKDEASQFMLQAITQTKKNPHACSTYVNNLFDNYALYYDQHMQGPLAYSLPQQIGRILHRLKFAKSKHSVDLGCGTGLSGVVLRELSERLTGVDISNKMLAQAKTKGIYDELVESELIKFLQKNKQHYDLAVAADVLPYLGELESLFAAVAKRLNKDGFFIFTHEISEKPGWQLQESARFSHHPDYIKQLCRKHGFTIMVEEKVVARKQEQQGLDVLLYVVAKTESPNPYQSHVAES